jgi:hypothetical protein
MGHKRTSHRRSKSTFVRFGLPAQPVDAMEHQAALLFRRLGRDEPHVDPGDRFADRLGISGKIVLREPSSDLKKNGLISVDNLYAILNDALKEHRLKIWVLLDRLDVAFVENHALEANALRALIRAYADIRNRDKISLKIFLREDIWKRITEQGLREASHLIRYVILDWTQPALLNLIMRRLLNNAVLIKEFGIDSAAVLQDAGQQEKLFYRFFRPK